MFNIKNIASQVVMPLLYINLLGMLVGAIWLVVVSQWQVVLIGFFTLFFSPYLIPIILIPAGIFSHFMVLHQNAKRLAKERLMFVLTIAYMLLFISFWCVGIWGFIVGNIKVEFLLPALIFGSSAAMAPIFLWVRRDRNNFFVIMLSEVAQVAVVILSLIRVFFPQLNLPLYFVFMFVFLVLAVVLQAFFDKKQIK